MEEKHRWKKNTEVEGKQRGGRKTEIKKNTD